MRWPLESWSCSRISRQLSLTVTGELKRLFKVPPNTNHYRISWNHASQDFFPSSSNFLSGFVSVDFGQVLTELKHLPPDSDCSACCYKHSLESFSKSSSSKPGCFPFLVFERYGNNYTDFMQFTYPIRPIYKQFLNLHLLLFKSMMSE